MIGETSSSLVSARPRTRPGAYHWGGTMTSWWEMSGQVWASIYATVARK